MWFRSTRQANKEDGATGEILGKLAGVSLTETEAILLANEGVLLLAEFVGILCIVYAEGLPPDGRKGQH